MSSKLDWITLENCLLSFFSLAMQPSTRSQQKYTEQEARTPLLALTAWFGYNNSPVARVLLNLLCCPGRDFSGVEVNPADMVLSVPRGEPTPGDATCKHIE